MKSGHMARGEYGVPEDAIVNVVEEVGADLMAAEG